MSGGSLIIIVPVVAWLIANLFKRILIRYNRRWLGTSTEAPNTNWLVMPSGGMPSAHSAVVSSLAATVACVDGIASDTLGIALWLAVIVMYDAVTVRYSSGQQGIALARLIDEQKSKVKKPVVAQGHTIAEVAVGAVLGVVVAIVVFFATRLF